MNTINENPYLNTRRCNRFIAYFVWVIKYNVFHLTNGYHIDELSHRDLWTSQFWQQRGTVTSYREPVASNDVHVWTNWYCSYNNCRQM